MGKSLATILAATLCMTSGHTSGRPIPRDFKALFEYTPPARPLTQRIATYQRKNKLESKVPMYIFTLGQCSAKKTQAGLIYNDTVFMCGGNDCSTWDLDKVQEDLRETDLCYTLRHIKEPRVETFLYDAIKRGTLTALWLDHRSQRLAVVEPPQTHVILLSESTAPAGQGNF
jgi:hypothetical protein